MIWRALLLAALVQFYPIVHAITDDWDDCEHELSIQVSAMKNRVARNLFITGRDFSEYERLLDAPGLPSLTEMLDDLPRGSVWLDLGAGEGLAQRQYLHEHDGSAGLHLVSFSFDKPKNDDRIAADLKEYAGFFTFVETGFLEDAMASPEHPANIWRGKVMLLTEVWGPTAYVRDINQAFDAIVDLLAVGGRARILMGSQTLYFRNKTELSVKEIAEAVAIATGGRLKVVSAEKRENNNWIAVFEKTGAVGTAPRFKLEEFWNEGPPRRVYAVP